MEVSRQFHSRGINPWYPFYKELSGHVNRCLHWEEKKNILCRESKPVCPARCLSPYQLNYPGFRNNTQCNESSHYADVPCYFECQNILHWLLESITSCCVIWILCWIFPVVCVAQFRYTKFPFRIVEHNSTNASIFVCFRSPSTSATLKTRHEYPYTLSYWINY
jgi:hypothetical protein